MVTVGRRQMEGEIPASKQEIEPFSLDARQAAVKPKMEALTKPIQEGACCCWCDAFGESAGDFRGMGVAGATWGETRAS